jgi:hypothetical protein
MACCAIAAFIIGQIYVMVMSLRRALFGDADPSRPQRRPGAAAWRLDSGVETRGPDTASQAIAQPRTLRWFEFSARRVVLVFVLSFAALGTAYAFERAAARTDQSSIFGRIATVLCSAGSRRTAP